MPWGTVDNNSLGIIGSFLSTSDRSRLQLTERRARHDPTPQIRERFDPVVARLDQSVGQLRAQVTAYLAATVPVIAANDHPQRDYYEGDGQRIQVLADRLRLEQTQAMAAFQSLRRPEDAATMAITNIQVALTGVGAAVGAQEMWLDARRAAVAAARTPGFMEALNLAL
ncbi:hypothetical protein AB7M22_001690 [Pseudomonas sp. ADAK2 TE3594]